jgi:hypothetical protein
MMLVVEVAMEMAAAAAAAAVATAVEAKGKTTAAVQAGLSEHGQSGVHASR